MSTRMRGTRPRPIPASPHQTGIRPGNRGGAGQIRLPWTCVSGGMQRAVRSPLRPQGFTLLELLVVLAILGLLAAFVAPRYFEQLGRSNTKVAQAQLHALADALDHYRVDVGRYPSTEQGLAALLVAPAGEARWQGPYLRRGLPLDPWGRPFLYTGPKAGTDLALRSLGRDGAAGGSGEDADVELR